MEARTAQLRAHLLETARKIVDVVARDIEKFGERESRWRFLRHVDFAESLMDHDIRSFKSAIKAFAAATGERVASQLGNEDLWLRHDVVPKGESTKSLEHNPRVWQEMQVIAAEFAKVLDQFGFPADPTDADDDGDLRKRYHLVYRTPVYFLDGVYCPSLIESYWNQLGELNKLSDEIASSRLDSRRKAIEERWNRI